MTAATQWPIVGVDVGGTFTDLFLSRRSRQARSAIAKVPSQRGDEAIGLPRRADQRLRRGRRSRLDRPRHHRRHQRAAGAQGRARRRDHHGRASATCWKCAAATAATPGACGAISPPSSTATCGSRSPERTLADGTIRTPVDLDAGARGRAGSCWPPGLRGARHHLHQRLRQSGQRARGRWTPLRAIWPNAHVACSIGDPARDPRIRAHLDHGAERLSAAGGRQLSRHARGCAGSGRLRRPLPHRAVQWRRDVDG